MSLPPPPCLSLLTEYYAHLLASNASLQFVGLELSLGLLDLAVLLQNLTVVGRVVAVPAVPLAVKVQRQAGLRVLVGRYGGTWRTETETAVQR